MSFTFIPLQRDHLDLLLAWLETPHVKAWWDQDVSWTPELIEEKYGTYVEGYKEEEGIRKPMSAFIISLGKKLIGYIQLYNAYDFPREDGLSLEGLPRSLAAIDIFIGDPDSVGKGYGSAVLRQFLDEQVLSKYEACFVDPDTSNIAAVKAYEKAGFKTVKQVQDGKVLWMVR